MKKLLHFIIALIISIGISFPKTAFAISSYLDKCESNVLTDIASYNNTSMSSNKKLLISTSSTIIYNIKNVKSITIRTFATNSTSIYSCDNKLYLTPFQGDDSISLDNCFVYVCGNEKYAVDQAGDIYHYIVDETIMFPRTYYFKKIDNTIPLDRYLGINVYSVNDKGDKTHLKQIKNKTTYANNNGSVRTYSCEKTFYVSNNTSKICIEYDYGAKKVFCEIPQITFQGENLVIGKTTEKPNESSKVPDKKPGKPDESSKVPDKKPGKSDESSKLPDKKPDKPDESSKVPDKKPGKPDESSKVPDKKPDKPDESSKLPDKKSDKPDESSKLPDMPYKPDEPDESSKVSEEKPTNSYIPSAGKNASRGSSSSRPNRSDWEIIGSGDCDINIPCISYDNMIQDSLPRSKEKFKGAIVEKKKKDKNNKKKNITKDIVKTKKEPGEKAKKLINKKEKKNVAETQIVISYNTDIPLSSPSSQKYERIIAIISICCSVIIIIKIAGSGFVKTKK